MGAFPLRVFLIACLIACSAVWGTLVSPATAGSLVATVGRAAPSFALEDLRGSPLTYRMLRGKPLFLNVFATWCGPCRLELPQIVQSFTQYRERVRYVGVDEQEPAGTILPFARQMGIRYTIGIDQGQMEASYRAHSVPTSIFIDRRGIVRAIYSGPIPQSVLRVNLALISRP